MRSQTLWRLSSRRILEFSLALLFLAASCLKLHAIGDARMEETWIYTLVGGSKALLAGIAIAELLFASTLLWGVAPRWSLIAAIAVIAFATAWTAATPDLLERQCGCFGPSAPQLLDRGGESSLIRNGLVLLSLLVLLLQPTHSDRKPNEATEGLTS